MVLRRHKKEIRYRIYEDSNNLQTWNTWNYVPYSLKPFQATFLSTFQILSSYILPGTI